MEIFLLSVIDWSESNSALEFASILEGKDQSLKAKDNTCGAILCDVLATTDDLPFG